MGANYGSIQVKTENRDAVKAAVEPVAQELKRKFLVGPPLNGWTGVYPDESGQDDTCAIALAKRLNETLLQLIVHDDSIFIYNLFRNGELIGEYSSNPDYFEELDEEEHERLKPRPELFADLINSPEKLAKLSRLLGASGNKPEFTFEQKRLGQFAQLLGIRNALTSYDYLNGGERYGVEEWKAFIHVPDLSAEKAAKKAAEAAVKNAKKECQKVGLLCNEWSVKKLDAGMGHESCVDPLNGGFLVLSRRAYEDPPGLKHLSPPWASAPPEIPLLSPSFTQASNLVMSRKGTWLALADIGGVRLWDWRNRQFLDRQPIEGSPVAFTQDEKLLLCKRQKNFVMLSVDSWQITEEIDTNREYPHFMALAPANRFLLSQPTDIHLAITDLQSKKTTVATFSEPSGSAPAFLAANEEARRLGMVDGGPGLCRGSSKIMRLTFSPDGKLLFCATTVGLRVYVWEDLLSLIPKTSTPFRALFAFTPLPEALRLDLMHHDNYIYDVLLDEVQNRLLFCGLQGLIRFLNLKDGSSGILLDPPGKSPTWRLLLSHDRKFICCMSAPPFEERNKKPNRLHVWDYAALCKQAGLEWSSHSSLQA